MSKMYVYLAHCPNPDIRNVGGYWSKMTRPEARAVSVSDFKMASRICREYIEAYELGGGNWIGGEITDSEGNRVAEVSYNGRVCDLDGKEIKV